MLVIPLSLHYTDTMITVVLWRQRVNLYEKANFVHFSTEIKCTSLRFIMITVVVFELIWPGALPDIIRIWIAAHTSRVQVSVSYCSTTISSFGRTSPTSTTYFILMLSQSSKNKTLRFGKCEGTNAKHPSPTNKR